MFVLDGALGTELEKRGKLGPLWSGQLVIDHPDIVKHIYKDYIKHGSDLITTATYQMLYEGMRENGWHGEDIERVWRRAIEVAKQAIEECGMVPGVEPALEPAASALERVEPKLEPAAPALERAAPAFAPVSPGRCGIIASIGPYGSYLNDGSEYTGAYTVSKQRLVDHHRPLAAFFNRQHDVDLIGFETVPNLLELQAIMDLIRSGTITKPVYVSFCLHDGLAVEDVVGAINGPIRPCNFVGIGVNCVDYQLVTGYLERLDRAQGGATRPLPYIIYPNYGYNPSSQRYHVDPAQWQLRVRQWLQHDVLGVGGCCSTTPREIALIRRAIADLPVGS